jgi:two-component system, OmpR family, KDP operon response regulator KdpE
MELTMILVIEDEKDIRRFVRTALEAEGYCVHEATTIKQGLVDAGSHTPVLVILDLGLPDGNGVEFIRDFRHWSQQSILVLSARSAENEKITALDAGADDYLTKPFSVGELLARVRALLRRSQPLTDSAQSVISFADVVVDLSRRHVTRAGNVVHLTPTEYDLLALLIASAGKVLTHRYLLKEVWGAAFVESNHYLRIYVGHLRQKLEADPAQPKHILTETGIGYRFQI